MSIGMNGGDYYDGNSDAAENGELKEYIRKLERNILESKKAGASQMYNELFGELDAILTFEERTSILGIKIIRLLNSKASSIVSKILDKETRDEWNTVNKQWTT